MSGALAGGDRERRSLGFFALHLLLMVLWMGLTGWGFSQALAGLAVGAGAIAAGARMVGSAGYVRSVLAVGQLAGLFALKLVAANLQLARDILRRRPRFAPSILAIDVSALGTLHTGLLLSLVSLTPGSLSVDLDPSQKTLFVHTLYSQDEGKARREVERYIALLQAIAGRPRPGGEAP